jgi:hypothetical protein
VWLSHKELGDHGGKGLFKALGGAKPVAIKGVAMHGIKPRPPQSSAMRARWGFTLPRNAVRVHYCHATCSRNRAICPSVHRSIGSTMPPVLNSTTLRCVMGGGKNSQELATLGQGTEQMEKAKRKLLRPLPQFVMLVFHPIPRHRNG